MTIFVCIQTGIADALIALSFVTEHILLALKQPLVFARSDCYLPSKISKDERNRIPDFSVSWLASRPAESHPNQTLS